MIYQGIKTAFIGNVLVDRTIDPVRLQPALQSGMIERTGINPKRLLPSGDPVQKDTMERRQRADQAFAHSFLGAAGGGVGEVSAQCSRSGPR